MPPKSKMKFTWNVGDFRDLKAKVNGENLKTININPRGGEASIKEADKYVKSTLRNLIKDNPNHQYQVIYASNGMWAPTKWLDNSSEYLTPDLAHYELDINNFPVEMIKINVKKSAKKFGGHSDPYNNCLYNALRWCLTYTVAEHMKTFPQEAWMLKKMLKIGKCDPVPLSLIPILEKKIKLNINVVGDYTYTSPHEHQRTCYVKLTDGHYKYCSNKPMEKALLTYSKERHLVFYDIVGDVIHTYDGSTLIKHTSFNRNLFKTCPHNTYMKVTKGEDLKHSYDTFILNCQHLQHIAEIDLSKYGYKYKNYALNLFYQHAKAFHFEALDPVEKVWLDETKMCGLMYSECVEGEMNVYDVNSFYTYLLSDSKKTYPMRKPVFETIEEIGDYVVFGIYRVRITNVDQRLFQINRNNHYTHIEVARARELGATVELIKDGEANLMRYLKGRANGHLLFKPYFDKIFKYKDEINKATGKTNPLIKKILNVLWGALCQRDNIRITDCIGVEFKSDEEIIIYTDYDGTDYYKVIKPFKRPHARIGAFLTAYGRTHVSKIVEPVVDEVYRIHTDGFYTTATMTTSNVLGELKLEKEGSFDIRSLNDIVVLT